MGREGKNKSACLFGRKLCMDKRWKVSHESETLLPESSLPFWILYWCFLFCFCEELFCVEVNYSFEIGRYRDVWTEFNLNWIFLIKSASIPNLISFIFIYILNRCKVYKLIYPMHLYTLWFNQFKKYLLITCDGYAL